MPAFSQSMAKYRTIAIGGLETRIDKYPTYSGTVSVNDGLSGNWPGTSRNPPRVFFEFFSKIYFFKNLETHLSWQVSGVSQINHHFQTTQTTLLNLKTIVPDSSELIVTLAVHRIRQRKESLSPFFA